MRLLVHSPMLNTASDGKLSIMDLRARLHTHITSSLVPRPHPKNRERGLVSLANFPVCAESAYYTTHPNNHIYVIDLVRLSRGKNSKECYIIDDGML